MKRSLVIGLFLTLAVVALAGYAYITKDSETSYLTASVERGNVVTTTTATGTVDAVIKVKVGSQLSGQVAELFADFNDEVQEGQPIAKLDPQTFQARVQEAKAALEIALADVRRREAAVERARAQLASAKATQEVIQAQTASAQAKHEGAKREFDRKRALADRGTVSMDVLDQIRAQRDAAAADLQAATAQEKVHSTTIEMAEAELAMAIADLQNAHASVSQKKAVLSQAEVELERTVIRAPIDGVIIKREVDRGQTVAASLEAPNLFTIAHDLRQMEVHTKVDEADIGRIHSGQRALFTVDAYPDRTFSGQVTQIRKGPEVVQNVVTYTVLISAENPDLILLPGMTAIVRIAVEEANEVLKVPNAALRFSPNGRMAVSTERSNGAVIWVLDDHGYPRQVQVELGASDARVTEIISGPLNAGQEVIVDKVTSRSKDKTFLGLRLGI